MRRKGMQITPLGHSLAVNRRHAERPAWTKAADHVRYEPRLPLTSSALNSCPRATDIDQTAMPKVTVYTRDGCHLCDEAQAMLLRFGLSPALVDVDLDPALQSEFGQCVPVVEIDGKVRFRGQINEVLLRRILGT